MVYLSPAPLYHSAPQAAVSLTIRIGGTAVIMEHFDAGAVPGPGRTAPRDPQPAGADDVLAHAEAAARRRRTLRPLVARDRDPRRRAVPDPVKREMIDWWGPIILEYYGATEGLGFTACDSAEWLAHPGTVGQAELGELTSSTRR